MLEAQAKHKHNEEFLVPDSCWASVIRFLAVSTQWRLGGMGGVVGLDYDAVIRYIWKVDAVRDKREAFIEVQVMERAALEILTRRDDHGGKGSKSSG